MKVFKMNEADWYFGETEQDAVDAYMECCDENPEGDYPELLSEKDLQNTTYSDCLDDPDSAKRSFYEQLQIEIKSNSKAGLFATCEY